MRTAVAGAVLLLAVSGCSASDAAPAEVEPLASATGSATAVSREPAPSISSKPVHSTRPEQSPSVIRPEQPMRGSPTEASAFARYYFTVVVNEAYATGDASQIASLSDPDCGSCANIVNDVERLAAVGRHVPGQRFKIRFAEAAQAGPEGDVVVDFRFSSDPYIEVDADGTALRQEPAQIDQDAQALLVRQDADWIVKAIRTV